MEAKKLIGQTVTWTSQAQGTRLEKTGEIVGLLPANHGLFAALKARRIVVPQSRVKGQDKSKNDRYIVAVARPTKRRGAIPTMDYYAPTVGMVDAQ